MTDVLSIEVVIDNSSHTGKNRDKICADYQNAFSNFTNITIFAT